MAGGPEMNYAKMSKFLSYHLRHHPEKIGIELDEGGWLVDAVPPRYMNEVHSERR